MNRGLLTSTLCAITVEVILRLWDRGLLADEPWTERIYDNWLHHWIEWKTRLSMQDVDDQIQDLHNYWDLLDEEDLAHASEIAKGETPLGGPIQLSHPTLGTMDELNEQSDQI